MLKNRLLSLFCAIVLLFSVFTVNAPAENGFDKLKSGSVTLFVGSENALVNGELTSIDKDNLSVKTLLKDNRAFVPVRFVSENMGATVTWSDVEKKVVVKLGDKDISFNINSAKMLVSGKEIALDTAPFISEGRTYLPLRAVSEALGKEVFYNNGLVIVSSQKDIFNTSTDGNTISSIIDKLNNLPVVGDFENLKKLLGTQQANSPIMYMAREDVKGVTQAPTATVSGSANAVAKDSVTGSGDYSQTNVQVQGVDEADVIKTDGEYIYKLNNDGVVIVKATPADSMKVVANIKNAEGFTPNEIYVDSKRLVIIGTSWNFKPFYSDTTPSPQANEQSKMMIRPGYIPQSEVTKVIVYDIANKENPVKSRELEVEGYYVSSRKIGSSIYMVTNKNLYYYGDFKEQQAVPYYRDSMVNENSKSVPLSDVRYFPGFENNRYLITAGINLDNTSQQMQVEAYLGASDNLYVSNDNMYVAVTNYKAYPMPLVKATEDASTSLVAPIRKPDDINTTIYKFALKDGKTTFLNKGDVTGTVLNQFSMDENDGYFKVATTSNMWQDTMQNNLYVLDSAMTTVGKIENIAPGEKIYSVRFMGKKAYMVTFRTVDPLFVIGLDEPTAPKILGKLKIPGYSDYLHPYDENHIIGFGKDTMTTKEDRTLYLGMKMAMFDVTDVENPKEMFVEKIGDRGTDSPVLQNHKALLFSKEKGLLAFPVNEMTVVGDKYDDNGYPQYGSFSFQGLYVYKIGLEHGFKLTGKLSHMSSVDYLKAGYYSADANKFIERAVYIGDNLFTASQRYIKANVIDSLKEIGSVEIMKP